MKYIVIVPQAKFDISLLNWLLTNVSEQNQLWKVELDTWDRRVVFFTNEEHSISFKNYFNL